MTSIIPPDNRNQLLSSILEELNKLSQSVQYRVEIPKNVNANAIADKVVEAMRKQEARRVPVVRYHKGGIVNGDLFDKLGKEIHATNVEKGFWEEPEMMDKYVAKLALIHSEVTEVLEALRKQQGKDKVTEEFADILIRTFDLYDTLVEAGEADPNLYDVTRKKMQANKERPPKHNHRWG